MRKPLDERCYCGHLKSNHRGSAVAPGQGMCEHQGCPCYKFTWKEFIFSKKKLTAAGVVVLFLAGACYATERAKALYRTHRLNIGTVEVSCDDGRAPSVVTPAGTHIVIVSCPLGRNQEEE